MRRAYRYKIRPTDSQMEFLSKCFGCCRFIYNYALAEKIDAYSKEKRSLSFFDLCNDIKRLRQVPEYEWLNEVPAMSLRYAVRNLHNAYVQFFNKKTGFPKYKSRKHSKASVTFAPNSTRFDFQKSKMRIPKLGWVRISGGRNFDPSSVKINYTTVSRDACGDYWCSVSIDDGRPNKPKAKVRKGTSVGIDFGIADFAVLSDGTKIQNRKFFEAERLRISKMQRCLSRKRSGNSVELESNRYANYKNKIARLHRRIENRRTDFLQKLSTVLVNRYDTICIEDLNVKGMTGNHNVAAAIESASWSRFIGMLQYKSEWYGINLLKVGRFYPSSQICSECGYRNSDTKSLSIREWTCPRCGTRHDRDVNAAINIRNSALENYYVNQSPEVTGITDADGADSENEAGTRSPARNYASDETSMKIRTRN